MYERPSITLYKTQKDLEKALTEAVIIFKGKKDIPVDNEGFCPIKYICESIKMSVPRLCYINRNHIVEMFFKDLVREIRFKGENLIKIDTFKDVESTHVLTDGIPVATIFNSPTDMNSALISAVHILKNKERIVSFDKSGYCSPDDLIKGIVDKMPYLSYLNRNHIVELVLKDKHRKMIFNGQDKIKYKVKKVVEPPEVLYFGTLSNLSKKMMENGIYSGTKHYLKLYSEKDRALNLAAKFIKMQSQKLVVLKIDAKKAHDEGLKFCTYVDGEYIVPEIKKEYIKCEIE